MKKYILAVIFLMPLLVFGQVTEKTSKKEKVKTEKASKEAKVKQEKVKAEKAPKEAKAKKVKPAKEVKQEKVKAEKAPKETKVKQEKVKAEKAPKETKAKKVKPAKEVKQEKVKAEKAPKETKVSLEDKELSIRNEFEAKKIAATQAFEKKKIAVKENYDALNAKIQSNYDAFKVKNSSTDKAKTNNDIKKEYIASTKYETEKATAMKSFDSKMLKLQTDFDKQIALLNSKCDNKLDKLHEVKTVKSVSSSKTRVGAVTTANNTVVTEPILNANRVEMVKPVSSEQVLMPNNITKNGDRNWAFGVQIGTDIGGAIPVPFKYIPSTFNPYPKLGISIGGRVSMNLKNRWSLGLEFTYKTVAMDADARVANQRFTKDGNTQYYSGSAKMAMSFTMMEFPLYVKWAMSKKFNSFLIFGGYFSTNLSQKFVTTAIKGYIGGEPDQVAGVVTEENPTIMTFTDYLGNIDFGAVVGYERRVWDRANIGIRLMVGFKDIFRPDMKYFDYKMLQMRASFYLEYDLFRIK